MEKELFEDSEVFIDFVEEPFIEEVGGVEPKPEPKDDTKENSTNISVADDTVSNLTRYINAARMYPLLTKTEEREVLIKAKNGEKRAKERLINSNLLIVVKVAHEYKNAFVDMMDLIQEGNCGLLTAIDKFNVERELRFCTYAVYWIRAFMLKYIFENAHLIRTGTTKEKRKLFWHLRKEQAELLKEGIQVSTEVLAENFNVSEKEIVETNNLLKGSISIDTLDNEGKPYISELATGDELRPDKMIENNNFSDALMNKLQEFGKKLKGREEIIFYDRLMRDEPLTLQEIGDRFSLTKERIRQIEAKLLKKLRFYLKHFKVN